MNNLWGKILCFFGIHDWIKPYGSKNHYSWYCGRCGRWLHE